MLLLLLPRRRPNVAELGRVPGAGDQWTDLRRHPDNDLAEGVVVLRPEGALIFADADHVRAAVRRRAGGDVDAVVLDLETVPFVDVDRGGDARPPAGGSPRDAASPARRARRREARDVLRAAGDDERHVFPSVGEAVAAAERPR